MNAARCRWLSRVLPCLLASNLGGCGKAESENAQSAVRVDPDPERPSRRDRNDAGPAESKAIEVDGSAPEAGGDEGPYLTCEALAEKYRDCGLLGAGDFDCHGHTEACTILCELNATCETLEQLVCETIDDDSPFWLCFLECLTGPSGFVCEEDGKAIPLTRFCDTVVDCADGSDERECPAMVCDAHWNNVVPEKQICDGIEHCFAGEDEANCPDFVCSDGSALAHGVQCDGFGDCFDGSDEQDCNLLGRDALLCPGGELISTVVTCNGTRDCPDGEDETDCDADGACMEASCGLSYVFVCTDGAVVSNLAVCDGRVDCADASDEPCSEACDDGSFVDWSVWCDGAPDCSDGSDEADCDEICDGFRNRDDWSDEVRCCDDPPCAKRTSCAEPLPR